tara:strand:+ start:554 stop:934 length:381 start_codon:yes stop_codon:yes gene_type:complete
MQKYLTFILLFSWLAHTEEWEYIISTADGNADFYVDTDAIREVDGLIYFWWKENISDVGESQLIQVKADCVSYKTKIVSFTTYPELELRGDPNIVDVDQYNLPWLPAPPGSVNETMLNYACATRNK